ncbi:transcription termination factor MTERF4, chloroplastic [Physcomitrium patens]|uniref:Transcription termination factor MTERF4, chloroplastic n=1 Tax=Physcomitrium patens TaxID=3218 RepID=A0A2K1JHL5_PHYPA|nr:transcription termination factor MTERF4, chloroplastic-like [Physcomitrium patens]PNR41009.1 hypothetical protein PHYPA_018412 [Physcomitrium patens]|eukprot:XP_024395393.1 transcription termination factor MTERF4, chloroplastic-like [Physcomitrella patens]
MAIGISKTIGTASHSPALPLAQFSLNENATNSASATVLSKISSPREVCSKAVRATCKGLGFMKWRDEIEGNFEGMGSSWSNRLGFCNSPVLVAEASLRPGQFAEPSVTAEEMEIYEKQLTEEEGVIVYLNSIGVDTASLDELEVDLPTSLAIVRERVEFLLKIGLTVEDINDYPLILGYSVRRNLIPVLTFLEELGVTSQSLPILVRKYPQVLHSSVVVDLLPHVEYLEGLGIRRADMGSVLTRYPNLLGFKIEGTISTSTAYLVMLGVNPRRLGFVFTQMPEILGMRVGNNIKRKVDFLKSFGLTQSSIAKIIETRPHFLGLDLTNQMRPVVDSLIEVGVAQDAISRVITQFPDILSLDVKGKLAERLTWLTEDVGVSADAIGGIIARLPQILAINTTKASARVEFLRQAEFSAADIASMVTNCPQLLAASIEKSLKPNLDYLVEKMERELTEVIEFPAYLLYNLEEVVQPRHEEITKSGVECSLAWMLNCADDIFRQRLSLEYAEQSNHNEEPDLPYIVTRRARLIDESEALSPLDREDEDESKSFVEPEGLEDSSDVPYVVTRRLRPVEEPLDDDDDAQSRFFE